jgi:hypothetical protein
MALHPKSSAMREISADKLIEHLRPPNAKLKAEAGLAIFRIPPCH